MEWNFKKENAFDARKEQGESLRKNWPNFVPVIVEKLSKTTGTQKLMVQSDLPMFQFYYIVRSRIKLRSEDALFFFINNKIPCSSATIGSIYQENADPDNFLYVAYGEESVYGNS
jgi:GABA(A) receptor-associated protein